MIAVGDAGSIEREHIAQCNETSMKTFLLSGRIPEVGSAEHCAGRNGWRRKGTKCTQCRERSERPWSRRDPIRQSAISGPHRFAKPTRFDTRKGGRPEGRPLGVFNLGVIDSCSLGRSLSLFAVGDFAFDPSPNGDVTNDGYDTKDQRSEILGDDDVGRDACTDDC
jgi:hypothetical protein